MGVLIDAVPFAAALVLIMRREGVGNVFAPAAGWAAVLRRAWGPSLAAWVLVVIGFAVDAFTTPELLPSVLVEPGSPAAKAGLVSGDRVVRLNEVPIERFTDLNAARPDRAAKVVIEAVGADGNHRQVALDPDEKGLLGLRHSGETRPQSWAACLWVGVSRPAQLWRLVLSSVGPKSAGRQATVLSSSNPRVSAVLVGASLSLPALWFVSFAIMFIAGKRSARVASEPRRL